VDLWFMMATSSWHANKRRHRKARARVKKQTL
jgi:hypothetical protein